MSESDQKIEFLHQDQEDKTLAICRAVERHYSRGETVVVLTADAEQSAYLTERLWSFSREAFIPHELASEVDSFEDCRVLLSDSEDVLPPADSLVLGKPCSMDRFSGYRVIVDFAEGYDEELLKASRERFKMYKNAGYQISYVRPGARKG